MNKVEYTLKNVDDLRQADAITVTQMWEIMLAALDPFVGKREGDARRFEKAAKMSERLYHAHDRNRPAT